MDERQVEPRPAQFEKAVYLVSCTKSKLCVPAPAKELYAASSWFSKAREYVKRQKQPWFVLSAKHGLVHPDEVITPYDCTLTDMGPAERLRWAKRVLAELQQHLEGVETVTFLASVPYRKLLIPALLGRGFCVSVPMEGLRQGEQSQWLKEQLR